MKTKAIILAIGLLALVGGGYWLNYRSARVSPGPNPKLALSRPAAPPQSTAPLAGAPPPSAASLPALLPGRVSPVFARSGEPFAVRFHALHALRGPLSRDEIIGLYAFLRTTGVRPGTLIGGEHVLKNDAMDALCRQKPPPPDLTSNLCALYNDGQQDEVTRDYALQHLVTLCLKGTGLSDSDKTDALAALWSAQTQTGGTLAGTALLGLHRLSTVDPGVAGLDTRQVSNAALHLALDPATGDLSRLTALQVCAERQLPEALPEAAKLARDCPSFPLRLAAVAALGVAGDAADEQLLQSLQARAEAPLQTALQSALARLDRRLHPTNHPDN